MTNRQVSSMLRDLSPLIACKNPYLLLTVACGFSARGSAHRGSLSERRLAKDVGRYMPEGKCSLGGGNSGTKNQV